MQRKGTYIGSRYPELQNKTALIIPGQRPGTVQAQFDCASLTREVPAQEDYNHHTGRKMIDEPAYTIHWGYGWHVFHEEEFSYA